MAESIAPPTRNTASVSDYLAAERTFLAWIRTGLAFMGFGFVVARFGLFLEEFRVVVPNVQKFVGGAHSVWFGTALILTGVSIDVFACVHHVNLVRQLNRGSAEFAQPSRAGVALAIFLGIVGLAMAGYLVSL